MEANTGWSKPLFVTERLEARALSLADAPALQSLVIECRDFILLTEGKEPSPSAGQEILTDSPPGRTPESKLVAGLYLKDDLVGVMDLVPDYPLGTWYIGLLMLSPLYRGQGLGQEIMEGISRWLQGRAEKLKLGVLERNPGGRRFWEAQGFTWVSQRDDYPVGDELVTVHVLEKEI